MKQYVILYKLSITFETELGLIEFLKDKVDNNLDFYYCQYT